MKKNLLTRFVLNIIQEQKYNMAKELDMNFVVEGVDYFPQHGSEYSAGYDLKACMNVDSIMIWPKETVKISTGIKIAIPEGYCGLILPRSGLATKKGLRPANTPGLIDSDYRGEVIVALHNDSRAPQKVSKGERIAQLVVIPFMKINFIPVDSLDETDRGSGGFGSTGNK